VTKKYYQPPFVEACGIISIKEKYSPRVSQIIDRYNESITSLIGTVSLKFLDDDILSLAQHIKWSTRASLARQDILRAADGNEALKLRINRLPAVEVYVLAEIIRVAHLDMIATPPPENVK
jgi:hypothetical protein